MFIRWDILRTWSAPLRAKGVQPHGKGVSFSCRSLASRSEVREPGTEGVSSGGGGTLPAPPPPPAFPTASLTWGLHQELPHLHEVASQAPLWGNPRQLSSLGLIPLGGEGQLSWGDSGGQAGWGVVTSVLVPHLAPLAQPLLFLRTYL